MRNDVVDLLYSTLGAVPHPEFGTLNLMPFMVEDDTTNALKRAVANGLADVLESAGMLASPTSDAAPERSIKVQCRSCSTTLMTTSVSHSGVANIPAATVITALGGLKTECPHDRKTLDDQRRLIQEAVQQAQGDK